MTDDPTPRHRFRGWRPRLLLALGSLLAVLLALELVVFRFVLAASDRPVPVFDGVVKYRAGDAGVHRVKNEIEAEFRINADGWNSAHPDYATDRTPGKSRIAIIGDSYVAAFQVPYDRSMAEQLAGELGESSFEVYRFGIDGAPLSHYLHMLRHEVVPYRPDLVVVLLIHNDFSESYQFKPGTYTSAFLKLELGADGGVEEIEPAPYRRPWFEILRQSATWRYLAKRQKVRFQALRDLVLGRRPDEIYQANIDVSKIAERRREDEIAARYVFGRLQETCREHGMELLLVMDGDRRGIEKGRPSTELDERGALHLNRSADEIAAELGIAFVDLQPVFEADFARHGERFRFEHDGHWNPRAHRLAAEAIADFVRERPHRPPSSAAGLDSDAPIIENRVSFLLVPS